MSNRACRGARSGARSATRWTEASTSRWLVAWEGEYWDRVNALTRVFPEAPSTLDALGATHRLALISNTQGQAGGGGHRLSAFPDLERAFECIVIAGENGVPAKPDPQPFLRCLRQMKLDPGDCFYVGDDYRFDVCGSRDVGMRPVWLKHRSVRRNWPDIDTDVPVITSLDELTGLCGYRLSPPSHEAVLGFRRGFELRFGP